MPSDMSDERGTVDFVSSVVLLRTVVSGETRRRGGHPNQQGTVAVVVVGGVRIVEIADAAATPRS